MTKVGKTKAELKELENQGIKDLKPSFVEIDPKSGLPLQNVQQKVKSFKGPLWVTYNIKALNLGFNERQRYEWFCVGFLVYYDKVVRNGADDHTIWFKWTKNTVQVFISPPPMSGEKDKNVNPTNGFTSDPPKPPPPPPPPLS